MDLMAKSSQKYWERRALRDYIKIVNRTEEYIHKELRDFYKSASEDINKDIEAFYQKYADKEKITLQQAKRKVKTADIKDAKISEAAKAKRNITRLELIQYQIDARVSELYDDVQANIYDYLYKTYGAGYTSAIGITGAEDYLSFTLLSRKAIEAAILQNWSGKNFSERIWGHRKNLGEELRRNIVSGLIKGEGVDKMSRRISKRMDVKFSDAKRLVRTESNYIFNKGALDGYAESGIVNDYQYLATLDNRTSQICRSLDNKIFPTAEAEPGRNYPPTHPNCRSTTVAYFGEDLSKTVRRAKADGESYLVSADTNYGSWRSGLTDEQNAAMETDLKMSRDKVSDKAQFERYKKILGSDAPKSLIKFQQIKYNNSEVYDLIKLDYSRRNRLINHPELALPNANKATAADAKFEKYLFNPENPKGYAKGKAFTSRLGYDISNWQELEKEILEKSIMFPAKDKGENGYGTQYEQKLILYGKTNKPTNVIIGWLTKDNETWLTSAYIKEASK